MARYTEMGCLVTSATKLRYAERAAITAIDPSRSTVHIPIASFAIGTDADLIDLAPRHARGRDAKRVLPIHLTVAIDTAQHRIAVCVGKRTPFGLGIVFGASGWVHRYSPFNAVLAISCNC